MLVGNSVGRRKISIVAWFALGILSLAVILFRLSVTVDLAFFLPAPKTVEEQVLMDRFGQGPGSRLLFITISGADAEDLHRKSGRLKSALVESGLFYNVLNGQEEFSLREMPPLLWRYRYLLADIDASIGGLRNALNERIADLAFFSGAETSELIAADPYHASLAVIERMVWPASLTQSAWISVDQRSAVLVADSKAASFDPGAQGEVIDFIRATADRIVDAPVELHGVGAYSVELQAIIKSEAQYRSALATVIVVIVLLMAYRRFSLLIIGMLPILLGALAGVAAIALLFGQIHGITLAFGFTLFGVAIDYPLHFFSHCKGRLPDAAIRSIWPTLRLGGLSTLVAYLAIAASGSQGLAQLGVFSAVAILVALYATRSLLPQIMPTDYGSGSPVEQNTPTVEALSSGRHVIWGVVLPLAGLLVLTQGSIWSNDLSTLTPLPSDTLKKDRLLRDALGAPDIRYLLSIRALAEEEALQLTEKLDVSLAEARGRGLIEEYRLATAILPSTLSQRQRQAQLKMIPDREQWVTSAAEKTPFRSDVFKPFIKDIDDSGKLPPLRAADFDGSVLAGYLNNHFYFDGQEWVSLVTLYGLSNPSRLRQWLQSDFPAATLVDLKAASESLAADYRSRINLVLLIGFSVIVVILVGRLGVSRRLVWVVGTLSASIAATIALNALVLDQLSIFNLIALVLVAGLGLDYTLFLSRRESREEMQMTRHAVVVCVVSTFLAFFILAFSAVPILASLGFTVATGVALNFLIARLGCTSS
jgi:predicted exporter